ncbi:hypothetical protein BDR03DRAFT_441251 [Suillus americanus]|nr:hypothetical protein BDR03DRAFT_441251 [Suillus americanus]
MGYQWKWRVGFGLSSPSLPACPKSLLLLETHKRQGEPHRETWPEVLVRTEFLKSLVPDGSTKYYNSDVDGEALTSSGSWLLGDWVTYDNPIYVDCDGTIHARLETRLKML